MALSFSAIFCGTERENIKKRFQDKNIDKGQKHHFHETVTPLCRLGAFIKHRAAVFYFLMLTRHTKKNRKPTIKF